MNRGILIKAARELWPATLLLGIALFVAQAALAYVLPTFSREIAGQIFRMKFLETFIRGLLGADVAGALGPELFASIGWVHPVVLTITWAHAIICCTRVPAGEVDRGTIDVLLGLPVSRWGLFVSETFAWLISAVILILMGAVGNFFGTAQAVNGFQPDFHHRVMVIVSLLSLYAAVGAMAWLMSAWSDRRGRAIGAVFAVVLASFLLNYLAQFWEPAQKISFLGLLQYYRPLFILRDDPWPTRDLTVLLCVAAVLWSLAGVIFARRDLSTV